MRNHFKILPIEEADQEKFFDFLNKDPILHIFTIYNLKFIRDRTEVWIAFKDKNIHGYIFEFDKRIVHTHGSVESTAELLKCIDLDEVLFVIEPGHLAVVEDVFKPIEPMDVASHGKITIFFVMKVNSKTFNPIIKHRVKKLGVEDLDDVLKQFGEERSKAIKKAIRRGIVYGAYYEKELLASLATSTEILDSVALIRGVYTHPSFRNRGLATSVCSAISKELLSLGKEVILWVAKDNLPAIRVYEKIGFKKTKYILLGFKARRRRK